MTSLEAVTILFVIGITTARFCRTPSLQEWAHVACVLLGAAISHVLSDEAATVVLLCGNFGLLLILFDIGLGIDAPPMKQLIRPLKLSFHWISLQFVIILVIGLISGLTSSECLVFAAVLIGTSRKLAFGSLKRFSRLTHAERPTILKVAISLEMLTMTILISASAGLLDKISSWTALKVILIAVAIYSASRFAETEGAAFPSLIEKAFTSRIQGLLLLVLLVRLFGELMNVNGGIAAFFLGLILSRTTLRGRALDQIMEPVSHGFFIPAFYVLVGILTDANALGNWMGLSILSMATFLFGLRHMIHQSWPRNASREGATRLFSPNFGFLCLGTLWFLKTGNSVAAFWLLLSGIVLMALARVFPAPAEKPVGSLAFPTANCTKQKIGAAVSAPAKVNISSRRLESP